MKKIFILIASAALAACNEPSAEPADALADPTGLKVEQTDLTTVRLTWTDNAEGEKGYRLYLRDKNSSASVPPSATLDADAESFTFENLTTGKSYDFGVQAISEDFNLHSEVIYIEDYKVLDKEELVEQGIISKTAAPSGLNAVQQEMGTEVTLSWTDNATDEKGYKVYVRKSSADAFAKPSAILDADTESYTFTGLTGGVSYVFGVQSTGETELNDSDISTTELTLADYSRIPVVTEVKTSYAYIAVSYKVQKLNGSNPEHGLCFSKDGEPDVNDIKVLGPAISANSEIMQVVPNAYLETDKDYFMRVFVKNGEEYVYSESQNVRLEVQPEEIVLDWESVQYEGLASEIKVYKTTSQLNGRNFNAWYAIADPAEVEFKVLNTPTGKSYLKTVEKQANEAEGCQLLINGGIFGNYHIGVIFVDGEPQEWVDNVYNNYWNPDGSGTLWNITRPVIGVDRSGKADAYWTASPKYGTYYYYTRPLATVAGEAKYPEASATAPEATSEWEPFNALSTGPMLLYDGKCCIDHQKTDGGSYYTNYECWALDIYEGRPDRTAVGITHDGKIVLFICDGRIDASQGATHEEVAMILKNIGCVHAMNLDGGGSTGMWVKGTGMINHLDGSSWRKVKSTLGFFKK